MNALLGLNALPLQVKCITHAAYRRQLCSVHCLELAAVPAQHIMSKDYGLQLSKRLKQCDGTAYGG